VPLLLGDPSEEAMLRVAGVERAAGLLACTADDRDNLVVTLTARQVNDRIRIISRATDPEMEAKMVRVGANAVVTPELIGGLRMASELVRPTVVSFLDQMLRDREKNLRVGEVTLPPDSPVVGRRLADAAPLDGTGALLLACRDAAGGWIYNPSGDFELNDSTTLIIMGTPADLSSIRTRLAPAATTPG
jgi:voltage-gated potassium channel